MSEKDKGEIFVKCCQSCGEEAAKENIRSAAEELPAFLESGGSNLCFKL